MKRSFKIVLMLAIAKHSMMGIPKSKDKHIELREQRNRQHTTISLIVG